MLELFRGGALAAATLTTGLMAGLYYAYAISVMLGHSRVWLPHLGSCVTRARAVTPDVT